MDEPTFSVTELNTVIRDALREAVPENVWVRGEVQGLRQSRAGHVYFQLVEKDERRDRVQAALDVALFRTHLMTVRAALRKTPGVELADDVEVRANAARDLPPVPLRVGLITSAGSAAYHDFLAELGRSNFAFRVGGCDVQVQGANAPRRVVWALRRMARLSAVLDAVVIVR